MRLDPKGLKVEGGGVSEENRGSDRRVVWFLVILPVWLVASSLIGFWLWKKGAEQNTEPAKFVTRIDETVLAADLTKMMNLVGPRHTGSEDGKRGLRRAAAMIEGTLGPSNAGYRIERVIGPVLDEESWPIITATLPGGAGPPLWIVAGYDQDPAGGGVEANATGVISLMAVAQDLAGDSLDCPVVFAFLPHAYDPESPWQPTFETFGRVAKKVERMLVVEGMGGGHPLMASSRDTEALTHPAIENAAEVVGAEAICLVDDGDLASRLFQSGQPAVRVATRGVVPEGDPDETRPEVAEHAAATVALAEMVRQLTTEID